MRVATMTAVQELLGHATIVMTMRDGHLAPEVVNETVRLLGTERPATDGAPAMIRQRSTASTGGE